MITGQGAMPTRRRHLVAGRLACGRESGAISRRPLCRFSQDRERGSAASQESSGLGAKATPAALYKTYCAQCHEGRRADAQAPSLEAMKRLTAEQVLESLERGSMRARAAERSRAQRRALAAYVSGKPLGDASAAMPKSAFCSAAAAPPPDVSGPMWNGWGHGITNARFQSTEPAGLTAGDVPRLRLRWAFGFPGATSAGTQPVVAGGRVYAATAEGELYVLDAKTGCVHWTLEVEASIRSAITLEQRASGELVATSATRARALASMRRLEDLVESRSRRPSSAAVTAAPQLYDGRLYVPVSSREESQVADPAILLLISRKRRRAGGDDRKTPLENVHRLANTGADGEE